MHMLRCLLWAIPGFLVLVLAGDSVWILHQKPIAYTFMDTLASLSSGMTNILKDVLGLGILLDFLSIFARKNSRWGTWKQP